MFTTTPALNDLKNEIIKIIKKRFDIQQYEKRNIKINELFYIDFVNFKPENIEISLFAQKKYYTIYIEHINKTTFAFQLIPYNHCGFNTIGNLDRLGLVFQAIYEDLLSS